MEELQQQQKKKKLHTSISIRVLPGNGQLIQEVYQWDTNRLSQEVRTGLKEIIQGWWSSQGSQWRTWPSPGLKGERWSTYQKSRSFRGRRVPQGRTSDSRQKHYLCQNQDDRGRVREKKRSRVLPFLLSSRLSWVSLWLSQPRGSRQGSPVIHGSASQGPQWGWLGRSVDLGDREDWTPSQLPILPIPRGQGWVPVIRKSIHREAN